MVHTRQSRLDRGLGFQVKVLKPSCVAPSSLGSGRSTSIGDVEELILARRNP